MRSFIYLLFAFTLSFFAQGQKKVNIKQADETYYQANSLQPARYRLVGHVVFEHEGALMHCDSAWLYKETNFLKAFSNVHLNQGDTLHLYSRYLEYDGNEKLARAVDSVKLEDGKMLLKTPEILFDRKNQTAFYTRGGRIWNGENRLTSKIGTYYSDSKTFVYRKKVVLTNPRYVITSDTLKYRTPNRTAYFIGPSTIVSDSSTIYCENGLYDTRTDIAQFEENARIINQEQLLTGDSIYYEKRTGYGEVFGHVYLLDTADQYLIRGNFAKYREKPEFAYVTGQAVYTILVEQDSLHIHGDTLRVNTLADSTRLLRVYRGVRIYKSNLQGRCDSLAYHSADSTFKLYHDPVLWNKDNQLTGNLILLEVRNGTMDSLKVYGNSFLASPDSTDPTKFNQIKGKDLFGKFINQELNKVLVKGNAQTGYFTKEEGSDDYIGYYRADCSSILFRMSNSQITHISFLTQPDTHLFPLEQIPPGEEKLKGFSWRLEERPLNKLDLFK